MPTYDYKCEKCGEVFERFQSIMDEPIKECPECSGPVRRLIGAGAGVIFKGSGFYQTDYTDKCPAASGDKSASSDKKSAPACDGCPCKD